MPAPRANHFRATRVPEGASGSTPGDRQLFQVPPPWPGITWGHDARCECSWAFKDGVMQVKRKSEACTVHVTGRTPAALAAIDLLTAAPTDAELLGAIRAGAVTWELYGAAVRSWRASREAASLAALLGPRIAELADLLLADTAGPPVTYCSCGRERDLVDATGKRRCSACRRRSSREATTRFRERKKAAAREAA